MLRAWPQFARTQSTGKYSPVIFPRRQTVFTNFDARCGLPWRTKTGGGGPASRKHSKVSEYSPLEGRTLNHEHLPRP